VTTGGGVTAAGSTAATAADTAVTTSWATVAAVSATVEPVAGAGVGRQGPTRRGLPDHASRDRVVDELAERCAGDVEQLQRLVDVVG